MVVSVMMDDLSEHEVVVRLLWLNCEDLQFSAEEQNVIRMHARRCTRLFGFRKGLLCEELLLLKCFGLQMITAVDGCEVHEWEPITEQQCPKCHWRDGLSLEDVYRYGRVRKEVGFWSEEQDKEWVEYLEERSRREEREEAVKVSSRCIAAPSRTFFL